MFATSTGGSSVSILFFLVAWLYGVFGDGSGSTLKADLVGRYSHGSSGVR